VSAALDDNAHHAIVIAKPDFCRLSGQGAWRG
jgi:hypothetical protein